MIYYVISYVLVAINTVYTLYIGKIKRIRLSFVLLWAFIPCPVYLWHIAFIPNVIALIAVPLAQLRLLTAVGYSNYSYEDL